MINRQSVCLRRLGGTRAGEMKLGRWIANDKVTTKEISAAIVEKSRLLSKDKHVLAIQDTTELNYEAKIGRIKGLGQVGHGGNSYGFYLHPMLVIDADKEECLGLASIKSWVRAEDEKKAKDRVRKLQPIEQKESYRWIESSLKAKQILCEARQVTIVADRESDIYEEWCRIPDKKTHLLTRACQDRLLSNTKKLFSHVKGLEVMGKYEVEVKAVPGKRRRAHLAKMEIRFDEVEINRPIKCSDKSAPNSVKLNVVDVLESQKSVLKNEKPIHWCLLTTHEIKNVEQALEIVHWYCMRWHIEQFFRVLQKQGIDIESSQIQTAAGLMKLATVACFAALRIMQLILARDGKEQSVSVVFTRTECKLLSKLQKKLEGRTEKQKNHYKATSLSWAAWIIARLGGWKGYSSESPPGPITFSRGLKNFQVIREGLSLLDVCID